MPSQEINQSSVNRSHESEIRTHKSDQPPQLRLISIEKVCALIGFRRSAVYKLVAEGELPPPIKFGSSRRAAARWIEGEIVDYLLRKASARNPVRITVCVEAVK